MSSHNEFPLFCMERECGEEEEGLDQSMDLETIVWTGMTTHMISVIWFKYGIYDDCYSALK